MFKSICGGVVVKIEIIKIGKNTKIEYTNRDRVCKSGSLRETIR